MKVKILFTLFLFPFFLNGFSQKNNTIFAITGQSNGNFNWTDLRCINMQSGAAEEVLFENGKSKFSFSNAVTNQPVRQISIEGLPAQLTTGNTTLSSQTIVINDPTPTVLKSAAIAYDKRHGKLFFASMHTGNLMWLDLKSGGSIPAFYTIQQPLIENKNFKDEALNITRMTIGADGNGYAITNDGNHLIQFTTGKKIIIADHGKLIDAETNNGISIHTQCGGWGGDIVADASGKLLLFTAFQNVFEIDLSTKVATYKGKISNLPPAFSVNGAAVDDENNVMISSANTFEGYFKVNIKDFIATKISTNGQVFNASDLSSSLLLNQHLNKTGTATLPAMETIGNQYVTIYPNPVSHGLIKISFPKKSAGKFDVAITDLQGRLIENKNIYIKYKGQTEDFKLHTKPVKGVYIIRITDAGNQKIFSDKIVIH